MNVKDVLIGIAKNKISKASEVSGRSEAEILSAINKGKDGGLEFARQIGLTKSAARDLYSQWGHLADKIPIIGRAVLDKEFNKILPHLDDSPQSGKSPKQARSKSAVDLSKYKRV